MNKKERYAKLANIINKWREEDLKRDDDEYEQVAYAIEEGLMTCSPRHLKDVDLEAVASLSDRGYRVRKDPCGEWRWSPPGEHDKTRHCDDFYHGWKLCRWHFAEWS